MASAAISRADLCAITVPRADAQSASDSSTEIPPSIFVQSTIPGYVDSSDAPRPADSAGRVVQLPASPGSTQLFLSAMMSLGVWQAGRSVKHMHLSHLPDWYHAGAVQIGHVTPIDLDFGNLVLCAFEPVLLAPILVPFDRQNDHSPPLLAQGAPTLTSPRGPPQRCA